MKTVTSALQRNQFRAGKVRFWKILGFMLASTCFMKGTLMRLKKYSSPTQVIPAMKWNQRRISWVASLPVMEGMTVEAAIATKWCIEFPPPTCSPTSKCTLRGPECPEKMGIRRRDGQAVMKGKDLANRGIVSGGAVESRKVCTLRAAAVNRQKTPRQVPVEKRRRSPYGTHIYPPKALSAVWRPTATISIVTPDPWFWRQRARSGQGIRSDLCGPRAWQAEASLAGRTRASIFPGRRHLLRLTGEGIAAGTDPRIRLAHLDVSLL